MNKMIAKSKVLSLGGLALALVALLMINLLSGLYFKNVRLDLTEKQLYTLSKGTKNILADLQEPVTLQLFFSEKFFTTLPSVVTYGNRVKDLLEEYAALSNGKLTLVVSDPAPFSELEDDAVKYGLQGVPVDSSGNQAYFGLVGLSAADEPKSIAFLQPDKEASLEYEITRLIYSLVKPERKVVGLLTSLPMLGMAANPFLPRGSTGEEWFIVNQLRQSFDVENLDQGIVKIPETIDVLMLVHPKNLSDELLFSIDQFVLNGGRLIAFVDPFSEADQPMNDPANPMAAMAAMDGDRSSNLKKLFDSWGVELVEGKIAVDKENAQQVQMQVGGRIKAVKYVGWMSFGQNQMNASDFITRDLEKVSLATPGFFRKKPNATADITPLIITSKQSMQLDSEQFKFGVNPSLLLRKYEPSGESFTLALRLSGNVDSAFPKGLEAVTSEERVKRSKDKINVILVADTDMLEDKHWVEVQNFFGNRMALPHANNDVFVLNAIENLSGSNDLISLRSRSKSTRVFTKVIELKKKAEQKFQDKERVLQSKLEETEAKLVQLQQGNSGSPILNPLQEQEVEGFRQEQLQTRKELRNVQHELVKSIENLGTTLKAINIVLMPLVVIIFGLIFSVIRKRRLTSVVH